MENIFNIPNEIKEEVFETLKEGSGEFKLERIVSAGQITPEGQWYDQEKDEWVVLIQGQAQLLFEKEKKIVYLNKGDYLTIKAHDRHRVIYTSEEPPCVWVAFHYTS